MAATASGRIGVVAAWSRYASTGSSVRPVRADDWPELEKIFAGALGRYQPFESVDEKIMPEAAKKSLEKTRSGGDGPWVRQAKVLDLINNDNQGQIDIEGMLLRDAVRAADAEAGGYYRWIYNTANV